MAHMKERKTKLWPACMKQQMIAVPACSPPLRHAWSGSGRQCQSRVGQGGHVVVAVSASQIAILSADVSARVLALVMLPAHRAPIPVRCQCSTTHVCC
eukprot:973163-Rhodomonas_salina.1